MEFELLDPIGSRLGQRGRERGACNIGRHGLGYVEPGGDVPLAIVAVVSTVVTNQPVGTTSITEYPGTLDQGAE